MSVNDGHDGRSTRRRKVLSLLGGLVGVSGTARRAVGTATSSPRDSSGNDGDDENSSNGERNDRDEYPRVDPDSIPEEPISEYAAEVAFHPNQRRAALSTGAFGDGFQLYVVQRVSDEDDVAESAWRITDTDGIVGGFEWEKDNWIRYDEAFTRYERKLPPSQKVFEPTVVEDVSFRGVNQL